MKTDIEAFHGAREARRAEARQTAALFLISGIDMAEALQTSGSERVQLRRRLQRLLERERLKGARGHWSYDLNRHIALGQALERLKPQRSGAG
ncbi:cytoplasmic protein [Nitratireductor sp. ZSWI3]|uniref:cytoplasmic protein n=1 Tax=Nitratireductor sp. ZSWI3 TaxID=2966359 RepID=UPI00214FF717|nr:cytoplasmic protein [Nitratireductor sp. ZSWI3]MCR4265328.1 cytoplasmic protein [Nitratireductor sp. ZSWI3]